MKMITALRKMYEAEIAHAQANIDVYLNSPVGIGEHPDVTLAIQDEIDKIAKWHDQIEVINKYFK